MANPKLIAGFVGTFIGGMIAGGMMMQHAIKKQLSQMMGGMDPNAMNAMMQQMATSNAKSAGMPVNIDPNQVQALTQQLSQLDPAMLAQLEKEMAHMSPQDIAALQQQLMGGAQVGNNLNVTSPTMPMVAANPVAPAYQVTAQRSPIMPLNITAAQLGTGSMRV